MPRLAVKEVYTFEELDESAKERVRDRYRNTAFDCDWYECTIDDFNTVCEMIGIELDTRRGRKSEKAVYFSLCNGGGADFAGSYSYAKGALREVKKYAPVDAKLHKIVADLQDVQRANFYQLEASINTDRNHMSVERADGCKPTDGAEDAVEEAMTSLASWLYVRLRNEYEWLNSDEQVDEMIVADGGTYDEDGFDSA